ncbi:MAG: acetate/propionate family kinase [Halieaceae bacterium]|nr:acetate/propionate family kinase [Halieaceae bacterium]
MNVLTINTGSSSIKYELLDAATGSQITTGLIEGLMTSAAFQEGVESLIAVAQEHKIDAVGHRVVHGGNKYSDAVRINNQVIDDIEHWSALAPLHNPRNLAGIRALMSAMSDIPHVAVFDTAFHATLPRRASTYAIDQKMAVKHKIRRYGFHGTSHQYVAQEAAKFMGRPLEELRLVSLHLGNGASACAIEYGRSVDTSMGMTPLEGLVMGTRSGDIDAGVLLALLRDEFDDMNELDAFLNNHSGLRGLSGLSNDLREIEAAAAGGEDSARLAITVFSHRARKYIGAYTAAMGGLDAVILTGGIGENSATLRHRILQRLDFLGITLDEDLNDSANVSHENRVENLCQSHCRTPALVVKTHEEGMIARQTEALLRLGTPAQFGIPIAVSGRHIHLDRKTFSRLFGATAEPTHYKDLSQPGQYACQEKVNLVGPRGTIDGVRLLGPLRSKNQVEVSRTDEFLLGVDAPVRDSGRVTGSAPIRLEGPVGAANLSEGLICARRHIHMHTDDAERFGVNNRDEVEVAITGGPRDLIFGDVLVRVSPGYRLEMHIDTDEANAAELASNTNGTIVYTNVDSATAELRATKTRTGNV